MGEVLAFILVFVVMLLAFAFIKWAPLGVLDDIIEIMGSVIGPAFLVAVTITVVYFTSEDVKASKNVEEKCAEICDPYKPEVTVVSGEEVCFCDTHFQKPE